mgnify:CR=1 FL=1|tara:strand:- start:263 stop:1198 length:936 start_codon:yes stop_codon:yes gene_type:complete
MQIEKDIRDSFFSGIYEVMKNDKNAVILTADHGAFYLTKISNDFSDRYINVGISEQNMVNVASGLALNGKSVYIYSINNFMILRALEQININLCAMNLNVNIVGTGAGFTYSTDGFTHHGLQDMAISMRLPNMQIYNSTDRINTYYMATQLSIKPGPKYFRIEKGTFDDIYTDESKLTDGFGVFNLDKNTQTVIISTGYLSHNSKKVAQDLSSKNNKIGFIDIFQIKPLNFSLINKGLKNIKNIIVIEENFYSGSLGELISSKLNKNNSRFLHIAVDEKIDFYYGNRDQIHKRNKIDINSLKSKVSEFLII